MTKENTVELIYPIRLDDWLARVLATKNCYKTWEEKTRFTSSTSLYEFSAQIEWNGDVNVHVHYSFDDGGIQGCGGLFTEIIRPFDEERLKKFRLIRMRELAEAEHERRLEEIRKAAIDNVFIELFGAEEFVKTKEIENAR